MSASIAFDPATELITPTPAKEFIGAFPARLSWRSRLSQNFLHAGASAAKVKNPQ
jgi:hypothetical protein